MRKVHNTLQYFCANFFFIYSGQHAAFRRSKRESAFPRVICTTYLKTILVKCNWNESQNQSKSFHARTVRKFSEKRAAYKCNFDFRLVYDRNLYFGLGRYRNWNPNWPILLADTVRLWTSCSFNAGWRGWTTICAIWRLQMISNYS